MPDFHIATVEDAYAYYVLVLGISEEIFLARGRRLPPGGRGKQERVRLLAPDGARGHEIGGREAAWQAQKNEAKIRFTADTSDFNKQIKSADSAMRELRSELRLNATQMKSSGASVEALTESKRILEAQEQALAQKVDALSGKLEAAQSIWGENSTEAQRYATQLNNARAQQENVRAAIEQANQAIEDQTRAESDARSAYGRLTAEISQQRSHVDQLERAYADAVLTYGENSRECQELRTELSRASAELRESESRMDRAERSARDLARGLDDAGDSADDAGISFGELAGADFVSDVAQDLIGTLMGLSEETDEYRTSMTQLNNTFEWSGRSADEAREVYQNFLGLLGDSDEAVEAAQDMNNLADTGADIDTWYSIAPGTVSAFGQALPVTSLVESANESIRCGQVVGGLADALNWTSINAEVLNTRLGSEHPAAMGAFNAALAEGMSNEDAMNAALAACSDEQERQQLVTAVLASQYSELGDGYLDATSDIDEARRASDDLKQAQADLAERITPLRTLVTEFAANGLGFLNENMSGVVSVVMALATAFVVLKGAMLMQGAANQLASLLNFVKMGIGGLSPPILVVAAALAALVGIFTWAYQEVEPFRAAIDQLVLTFQQTFGPMIQQLMTYLGSVMQQAMPMLASFLTTYVVPAIQQFADFLVTTVFPALQQFANWFTVNILPVLQQLWNFVLTNILPLLQQFADFIVTTVVPALGNLWSWFSANILPVLQQIWSFFVANILPILGQFASFVLGTVVLKRSGTSGHGSATTSSRSSATSELHQLEHPAGLLVPRRVRDRHGRAWRSRACGAGSATTSSRSSRTWGQGQVARRPLRGGCRLHRRTQDRVSEVQATPPQVFRRLLPHPATGSELLGRVVREGRRAEQADDLRLERREPHGRRRGGAGGGRADRRAPGGTSLTRSRQRTPVAPT